MAVDRYVLPDRYIYLSREASQSHYLTSFYNSCIYYSNMYFSLFFINVQVINQHFCLFC